MESGWSADEVRNLKLLRLDPVKSSRTKLVTLVLHFKGPKPSVWGVTGGAFEERVSNSLATKVRDLNLDGKLDWLLEPQTPTSLGSGGDSGTIGEAAGIAWHHQMEESCHWPELRKIAGTLAEQIEAPVPQLLKLSEWDSRNEDLMIDSAGAKTDVSLKAEKDLLFCALIEHLPAHNAWLLLEEWKSRVTNLIDQLPRLCRWVLEHVDGPAMNNSLTSRFAATIVSLAVEDVYLRRPEDDFHTRSMENAYETSKDGDLWSLTLVLVGVRYAIARLKNQDELENIKSRHIKLRGEIKLSDAMDAIVNDYRQLTQIGDELRKDLEQLAHRAAFPGRCGLCSE